MHFGTRISSGNVVDAVSFSGGSLNKRIGRLPVVKTQINERDSIQVYREEEDDDYIVVDASSNDTKEMAAGKEGDERQVVRSFIKAGDGQKGERNFFLFLKTRQDLHSKQNKPYCVVLVVVNTRKS